MHLIKQNRKQYHHLNYGIAPVKQFSDIATEKRIYNLELPFFSTYQKKALFHSAFSPFDAPHREQAHERRHFLAPADHQKRF